MNQAISMVRLVLKDEILIKYLVYALNSPLVQKTLIKQKKLVAIPNLTLEIIRECELPIPPYLEQERISNKIDLIFHCIN